MSGVAIATACMFTIIKHSMHYKDRKQEYEYILGFGIFF